MREEEYMLSIMNQQIQTLTDIELIDALKEELYEYNSENLYKKQRIMLVADEVKVRLLMNQATSKSIH